MNEKHILREALGIIDTLIQNRSLRYHEHITDWKYDLAMEGYTLWLSDPSWSLKEAIQRVHRNRINKLRERSAKRGYAVVIPFSCVANNTLETSDPVPGNTSNLEEYDNWWTQFESIKPLLTPGEEDVICMLMDGLNIKEICQAMSITPPTVYRTIKNVREKIGKDKINGRKDMP